MSTFVRALPAALLSLLLVPLTLLATAPAHADTPFTVNDAGDGHDAAMDGVCETASGNGTCTLRAALEEAGGAGGQVVPIGIDLPAGATIDLTSAVLIPANTTVDGCNWEDATQPCVTIRGSELGAPVRLTGAGATLQNVAVVTTDGASGGIVVAGDDTFVRQVWVGMDTAGTAYPLTVGILVLGDRAAIGGSGSSFRSTIVNSETGVEIDGADNVVVAGVNAGLNASGMPAARGGHPVAGGHVGVRITSSDADVPENTNIGGLLTAGEEATPACDGACNAIGQMSDAAIEVDLAGSAAPSVYVNGNHLGLGVDGVTPAALGTAVGIDAGASTMIVGGTGSSSRNVVAGGRVGILHDAAVGNVSVADAVIGTDATGEVALPPTDFGVSARGDYSGLSRSRVVVAPHATGADFAGDVSTIDRNVFGLLAGGTPAPMTHAVRVSGDLGSVGATDPDKGNTICSSTGGAAVVIAGGDKNAVRSNRIGVDESGTACTGSRANKAGVVVKQVDADVASGNTVGGSSGSENTISNSVKNAVTIASTAGNNAVHNIGSGNGGLMVDIGGFLAGTPDDGDGPGIPAENSDVETTQIVAASGQVINGQGGVAGHYVYVYATDSPVGAAPHGVATLLGETQISGAGDGTWTFTPDVALAPGTRITAITQSRPDNSVAEFSTVVAVAADSAPPGGQGTSSALTVSGRPRLQGKARVGKKVKVAIPASTPAGAVVTVQWFVGKRAVNAATKPAFRLRARYLGKKVSARVTWTFPGSAPVVLATARVKVGR